MKRLLGAAVLGALPLFAALPPTPAGAIAVEPGAAACAIVVSGGTDTCSFVAVLDQTVMVVASVFGTTTATLTSAGSLGCATAGTVADTATVTAPAGALVTFSALQPLCMYTLTVTSTGNGSAVVA